MGKNGPFLPVGTAVAANWHSSPSASCGGELWLSFGYLRCAARAVHSLDKMLKTLGIADDSIGLVGSVEAIYDALDTAITKAPKTRTRL